MDGFHYFQSDPQTRHGDQADRYPENFVKFPWFLKPADWIDSYSRKRKGKPAFLLKGHLVNLFDKVTLSDERWGQQEDLAALRQALVLLGNGLDNNPFITPMGRLMLKGISATHLKNREKTIRFYEANRDFIETNGNYRAPVIVTGSARTGTTLLHRLLSEDPNTRSPYTYEMEQSVPPLQAGMDPLQDPRVKKSKASLAMLKKMAPGFIERFSESHYLSPTEREESLLYMQIHNGIHVLNAPQAGREYLSAISSAELAGPIFHYERNFFTMLDAYNPAKSHWTNKAPSYAVHFDQLFNYIPDARVIVTHRNPSRNFASLCRLLESWLLPSCLDGSFDKHQFSKLIQEYFCRAYKTPLAFRQANPHYESQIMDCMYPDLVRDPIAKVKQIYEKFDLEYTGEFEKRMRRYLKENAQGRHGQHRYSNEEYGIDTTELYHHNKAYYDHYGFSIEAADDD